MRRRNREIGRRRLCTYQNKALEMLQINLHLITFQCYTLATDDFSICLLNSHRRVWFCLLDIYQV